MKQPQQNKGGNKAYKGDGKKVEMGCRPL